MWLVYKTKLRSKLINSKSSMNDQLITQMSYV